jgi:hypothetical protein
MANLSKVVRLTAIAAFAAICFPTSCFAIAGGAIDLTNGAMIVTTSSFGFVPSGGFPNEYGLPGVPEYGDRAIHDAIVEGLNSPNGYWNGTNGITSSKAADDPSGLTGIGWIDNGLSGVYTTFRGVTVPPGSSIIAYTYVGDTDLNGYVDSADYTALTNLFHFKHNGYLDPNMGVDWFDGDVDYSGEIDSADYTYLTNAFHAPALYTAAPIVAPSETLVVPIPEPGTFLLLLVGAVSAYWGRSLWKVRH